jgi:two-component system, cell cycle sensor histidine kinase and response regulator CckA
MLRGLGDPYVLMTVLVVLTATALALALWLFIILRRQGQHLKTGQAEQADLIKLYAELVESASDVIFQLDADGRIIAMNQAGARMLGIDRESLLGRKLSEFLPPSLSKTFEMEGSKEYNLGELTLLDSQRRPVFLETSFRRQRVDGKVKSIEVIARNVTERRGLETQVRQSERMQAMGFLAGGVAHDFNNYLTIINTYVDLAQETTKDTEITSLLGEIRSAVRGAARMAQLMLDFSRGQSLPPKPVNLNELITSMQKLLQGSVGKSITLDVQLGTAIPKIIIDRGSLEQVLLNLVLNARDAMPQGGRVTIKTSTRPPNYAVLEISDTGQGMDDETKTQIFQPFFTTKQEGKGTGLGLATVQRVIMKANGKIQVDSKPGEGTTFRLEFPSSTHGDVSRDALADRPHSPPRFF